MVAMAVCTRRQRSSHSPSTTFTPESTAPDNYEVAVKLNPQYGRVAPSIILAQLRAQISTTGSNDYELPHLDPSRTDYELPNLNPSNQLYDSYDYASLAPSHQVYA